MPSCHSAGSQDTNTISYNINFVNVPVGKVLDYYKELMGLDLVISTDVPLTRQGITVRAVNMNTSRDAVAKLVEQSLLKQTGIVITRLDGKRASVTYNDQLPLQK
jgi:hypothetical protein